MSFTFTLSTGFDRFRRFIFGRLCLVSAQMYSITKPYIINGI